MTSTDESPPKYKLELDRNGWKCTSQHFRVVSNVIKIKNSDAEADITPSEQQRRKTSDHLGNFSQHKQQYRTDPLFQLWMNKIGPYLADWVLDKRASNDPTALTIPWRLIDFPENYTLWVHITGDHTDPANPRTDAYLYGAPNKIFRSPMEFVEHAIWLMKGGGSGNDDDDDDDDDADESTLRCQCKYCTPGQNQRAINRRLNHGTEDAEDEDSDGDGGGGGRGHGTAAARVPGINDSTRHRLFRNRPGPGASAAARRRAAIRDRSPVGIKAKDYRVGNQGGSGGGGGAGSGSGAGAGAGAGAGGMAV